MALFVFYLLAFKSRFLGFHVVPQIRKSLAGDEEMQILREATVARQDLRPVPLYLAINAIN